MSNLRDVAKEMRDAAEEIGFEALGAFSQKHPEVRMNKAEWDDLQEMIEREVRGHFEEGCEMSAFDLLPDRSGKP